MPDAPDNNGAYSVAGWDIQQTGAGDWRASAIDANGDYVENEYFETKAAAFRHAETHARVAIVSDTHPEISQDVARQMLAALRMITAMYGDDLTHQKFRAAANHYAKQALASVEPSP